MSQFVAQMEWTVPGIDVLRSEGRAGGVKERWEMAQGSEKGWEEVEASVSEEDDIGGVCGGSRRDGVRTLRGRE